LAAIAVGSSVSFPSSRRYNAATNPDPFNQRRTVVMLFRWSVFIVLAGLIFLAGLIPTSASAASTNQDVASAMTAAATKFISTLDNTDKAKVLYKFDDPARLDWHNIPKPERKGLQIRDMNDAQRAACHDLLKAALSTVGYEKAVKIMALENNLREGEKNMKGTPLRDPDRYFLSIFGQPSDKGTWGWSFEGHHFSLNFVIRDGAVVSDTPSFWGANPATVKVFIPGGPEVGTRTLAEEEQFALDLVNSFNDSQKQRATIADKAPAEYRGGGTPHAPQTPPEGLVASEMTVGQQNTLRKLLTAYCSNLTGPLAESRLIDIEGAKLDRVYFGWAGATKQGEPHYYRVQGPTFVLELVNYQSDPAGNPANHIHSVWRSMNNDFALPAK
jgi:hypothetical protein